MPGHLLRPAERRAQPVYAESAMETARTFRWLCHLPLCHTEGLLGAVLRLMDRVLPCPDHTPLSRRHATVEVRQQSDRALQGAVCVIVDSTGLQVCGQGAWHTQKQGEKKRKSWKKRHRGVDDGRNGMRPISGGSLARSLRNRLRELGRPPS
jgi:hypothetical protein